MDASLVAQPTGIEAWLTANGALIQVVLYAAQFLFWVIMMVASLWAVSLFKRLVDFKTAGAAADASVDAVGTVVATEKPAREPVQVEEFVD